MKCKNCGFDIGDFPFCPKCGTKAEMEETPAPESEVKAVPTDTPTVVPTVPASKEEKKEGVPKFLIVIGLALLVFIFIALGTSSKLSSSSKPSTSSSSSSSGTSSSYSSSSSSSSSSYTTYSTPKPSKPSNADIERAAANALYNALMNGKDDWGYAYSKKYNIDQTRYSVGSITETSTGWTVKGTFSVYDDYGQYKNSGTFTATIRESSYSGLSGTCQIRFS